MKENTLSNLPVGITLLTTEESNSPAIRYAIRQGALVRGAPVAPRVVMPAELAGDPRAWVCAVHCADPDLPVTGRAALWATRGLEPVLPIPVITSGSRRSTPKVKFIRTTVPHDLVIGTQTGTCTVDEISAMVCMALGDLETVCEALRKGWVTQETLAEAAAMLPNNSWLGRRAPAILADLAGNPWSVAELGLHRILRKAGIHAWTGNRAIHLGDGQDRAPDIAMPEHGLLLEVNSIEFHSGAEALERDTRRMADFMRAGWAVIALTPSMIAEDPDGVLDLIRTQMAPQRVRDSRRDQCRWSNDP